MNRKKKAALAAVLALCLMAAGCTEQPQETESETSEQTKLQVEIGNLTEAETQSEIETETEVAEETEEQPIGTVIGSLADIDMEQLTLLSDNGNEIVFPVQGVELDFRRGFRVGNLAMVTYAGELTETDGRRCGVKVLRAADSADVEELTQSPKEEESESDGEAPVEDTEQSDTDSGETETESAAEGESETEKEEQTLQGKLQTLGLGSLTLLDGEGKTLELSVVNARMYFPEGLQKDLEITVVYTGDLSGEDVQVLSVTGERLPEADKAPEKETSSGELQSEGQETETESSSETDRE